MEVKYVRYVSKETRLYTVTDAKSRSVRSVVRLISGVMAADMWTRRSFAQPVIRTAAPTPMAEILNRENP